jgi:nitrogen regulatory protein P-II 1
MAILDVLPPKTCKICKKHLTVAIPSRRFPDREPDLWLTHHYSTGTMKLITTIVRPERLPDVKAALFRAGITGITLSRVSGHGGEQEVVGQYRGTTVVMEFHEKVKIEMAVSEPFVEATIKAILASARTGEVGDGKIFVQPLERVIRIRTGEADNAALTAVNADQVQRHALEVAQHGEKS